MVLPYHSEKFAHVRAGVSHEFLSTVRCLNHDLPGTAKKRKVLGTYDANPKSGRARLEPGSKIRLRQGDLAEGIGASDVDSIFRGIKILASFIRHSPVEGA